MDKALYALEKIGSTTISTCEKVGHFSLFLAQIVKHIFVPRYYFKKILRQALEVGYYSLPVVGLTAIFTGAVLALQSYSGFSRFNAESSIATVVVLSITRELGPVLGGLMISGRVGASIAAEIGTMKVTEQIDALITLSTNPFKFLFVPRVIALIITLPILVLIADIIGIMGGYLISVYNLGFSSGGYLRNTFEYLKLFDVSSGLIKAAVFGFIVSTIGCYCGYSTKGGAEGVGIATTNSVVYSSVLILLFNYLITSILF